MRQAHFQDPNIELLRFATAGSVDDGKSTLIGRLLYDAKALFDDQLEELEKNFDLARLTDGLRAERAQGITIDVAYRYFATPKRRFVIADCPGHVQYTKNAVTGMSTAEALVLLVDVRKGILEQTRRHAFLAATLKVPHVVFGVNKLDLVSYDESSFRTVESLLRDLGTQLGLESVHVVPISALAGDNVTERSDRLPWYQGPTLIERLESLPTQRASADAPARFFVQTVLRPESAELPSRLYAGPVLSGRLHVGQEVVVLPAGVRTRIAALETADGPRTAVRAPANPSLGFADEVDASRGDLVVPLEDVPAQARAFTLTVSWMHEKALTPGRRLILKSPSRKTRAQVRRVHYRMDLATLEADIEAKSLGLNDIGEVEILTADPLALDVYANNPTNGRVVFIDADTKETVGAGLVETIHAD